MYGKLFLDKSFFPKRGMPVSELGELSRAVFINRENELKTEKESISENFIVFGRNSTFT